MEDSQETIRPPDMTSFNDEGQLQLIKASSLYNMLPTVVRSRIPKLPSLRRSLSTASNSPRNGSRQASPSSVRTRSGLETPPPSYASSESLDTDDVSECYETQQRVALSRPGSSNSAGYEVAFPAALPPRPPPQDERQSGIRWNFAYQGYGLFTQALREASTASSVPEMAQTSSLLSRQLYLHGTTYILRALPDDLTPDEKMSITAALPESIILESAASPHYLSTTDTIRPEQHEQQQPPPSLLHRTLASTTFHAFLVLHLALPYIKVLLATLHRYEREHHVSERMLRSGLATADSMGQRGWQLATTVGRLNDGKVGQQLADTGAWVARGVLGGVSQGVEDGLRVWVGNEDKVAVVAPLQ